jgi:hypothetical protein
MMEPDWNGKRRDICFRTDWIHTSYIYSVVIYIIISPVNCFRPTRHINVYCVSSTYSARAHVQMTADRSILWERSPETIYIYTYLLSRYSFNTARSFRRGVTIMCIEISIYRYIYTLHINKWILTFWRCP